MAEGEGFEPPGPFGPLGFEASALNRTRPPLSMAKRTGFGPAPSRLTAGRSTVKLPLQYGGRGEIRTLGPRRTAALAARCHSPLGHPPALVDRIGFEPTSECLQDIRSPIKLPAHYGKDGEGRTPNLLGVDQALYQLSYVPTFVNW